MKLSDLPNIGSVIEEQLDDVEIDSVETLRAIGAEEAWLRILAVDTGVHEPAFGAGGSSAGREEGPVIRRTASGVEEILPAA